MGKTYTEAEAVEAVAAALIFAKLDVARNAADATGDTIEGIWGYTFRVDEGARELLAEGERIREANGIAFGMPDGQPMIAYDLSRAVREWLAAKEEGEPEGAEQGPESRPNIR